MSAMGHEQTSRHVRVMSAIPLKADIHQRGLHVRLVPEADIRGSHPGARRICNLTGVLSESSRCVSLAPIVAKATLWAELLSAEVKSSEGGIERINPVLIRMLAHPTY
jgi:hypothetical protein